MAVVLLRRPLRQPKTNRAVSVAAAVLLLLNELVLYVSEILEGTWSPATSLPFHICELVVYVTAAALIWRKPSLFQIVYFWAFSGILHGILTPNLPSDFPSVAFLHYFVYHAIVPAAVLLLATTTSLRPTWKGLWGVFFGSAALLPVIALIDWVLDANYWFLREQPGGGNLTHAFEWPWYVVVVVLLGIVHFLVLYLPYAIWDRRRRAP